MPRRDRVIFLDFDGVLNVETDEVDDSRELWTAAWLEPALVGRLATLVEATDAVVVISSSWRLRRTLDELRDILRTHAFEGTIVDVTPRHPRPPEGERLVRASEVRAWLDADPEVTSYVIIDDEEDFGGAKSRHVRVDPSVGLTAADVALAEAILCVGHWRSHRDERLGTS